MRNLRLEIQYDGEAYFGWQRQAGFPTVQECLEQAIEKVTGAAATVHGSGRTDTGVHAIRQVANFRTSSPLAEEKILKALNAYLPRDIVVLRCELASSRFHARFDARSKRYLYAVRSSRIPFPLGRKYLYWVPHRLDLEKMRRAASHFVGQHDFRSFCGTAKTPRNTRRHLLSFKIVPSKDLFLFVVEADGFLLHMVRTLVGTLIEVGRGKMDAEEIPRILASKDRKQAGPTAPAQGLYLLRVRYGAKDRKGSEKKVDDSAES